MNGTRVTVMNISITKQYVLKGIAIIGMMAWHFWGNPQWIIANNMYRGILPNRMYEIAGQFGNICVSIFAFLTGYSFYIRNDKWEDGRYRLKKSISFLREYWVYMIIFIIIGLLCGGGHPSITMLLYNMFGMGVGVGTEYVCVPFAWYVSFYLSVILLYPLLLKILNCKLPVCICLLIISYWVIEWLHICTLERLPIVAEFFRKENTLVPVYVGYLFGRYKILDKLLHTKQNGRWVYYGMGGCTILSVLLLRCWNPAFMVNLWGVVYTLFVVIFVCMELPDIDSAKAGKPLIYLGKYSMGMWFISGIFFIPTGKLQSFAYFPAYPLAVLIWVTALSFIASYMITKSLRFVESKIRRSTDV